MSQQMIAISEVLDGAGIRVMFHDTDVFVLLLHFYRLREGCGKVNFAVRIIIVSAPKLQSQPKQVEPFSSMHSHPTFKRAFGDTHVSLGFRC